MENQHKKITGYRELNQEEIDSMNKIKEKGKEIEEMLSELSDIEGIDHRWLSIATTGFQKALMFAVRAIAKPDSF